MVSNPAFESQALSLGDLGLVNLTSPSIPFLYLPSRFD